MTDAPFEHAIEVDGLYKCFGDLEVLKGINVVVDPRDVVCVIGPAGSGKSTLLRCVNRLEHPTSGRIPIEGVAWRDALHATGVTHKRTRPYRPQTNGKVERFHRGLLEEWAHVRDWNSDDQRRAAYGHFIHFYNHHRSHGALSWATPIATLHHLNRDNLPAEHT
jgi:ABC-type multidrug transport system ATPase subunit